MPFKPHPLPAKLPPRLAAVQPVRSAQQKVTGQGWRALLLLSISSLLLLGGLGSRITFLQLFESSYYRKLADNNRIRLIPRPPERGRILDRNGLLLAGSRLSHSVYIWPLAQPRAAWLEMLPRLSQLLGIPPGEILEKLEQAGYRSPLPVRIVRNASPALIVRLEELGPSLPGVIVEAETIRHYPNGSLAAHLLGYTGEITLEKLRANPDDNYRLGDIVGQMGVEHLFESQLRGQWGGQQVEVDASGEVLQILGEQPPQAGQTVQLTLDLRLQQVAEQALARRRGAVVAMDPRDGAILAMASYPNFDPNLFSSRITQAQWDALQRRQFPFLNRTVRAFPPASVFKIITTAAGIESGIFPPNTVLMTTPYIRVSGRAFWDWNRAGFGMLGFEQAMAWSSDTFFYQIALGTGPVPIQEWSRKFGLGQTTGSGLLGESPGFVPDAEWKQRVLREPWFVGDTVNSSIGQGFFTATPLQMARVTAAVANGGSLVRPIFSYESLGPSRDPHPQVVLSPVTDRILRNGLRDVVLYGTGQAVALPNVAVAGKTGTAEDPPRLSHAWFVSYAPAENPEIVVVAFLENSGGGGGRMAAPICRAVLETYFRYRSPTGRAPQR